MIDCLVIGGGVAGASVAYFLAESGAQVSVIDESGFCGAASLAAGAFINPVMGKPSKFKEFADEAFRFSVDFYSSRFCNLFNKCGSLIYPKNEKTTAEFKALSTHIPSPYEFCDDMGEIGAFLVYDAGIINPKALIDKLLSNVQRIEGRAMLEKIDGGWRAGGVEAKNVVLAQGATAPAIGEPYLDAQLYGLWGQKCKIECDTKIDRNISSKVHIAKIEGGLAIGATHIRSKKPLAINREDSLKLIKEAREIVSIGDFEVVEETGGMRVASVDHFPLAGAVYNSAATLERFPSLIHGTRLFGEMPSKYDGLYIHTGHGSRAFILAPYTAKLLASEILGGVQTPLAINPARLLFRYFKKYSGR